MTTAALCSAREADVLAHTSKTGRFVTDEASVIAMAAAGLLRDHGAQRLAGGMHYFTLTEKGRQALAAFRAAQTPPPRTKRRRSTPVFEAWLEFGRGDCSFSLWWKNRKAEL